MFGAKGPNSSQYDFKGNTVNLSKFSSNHLQAHTNPLHPVQVAPSVAMQEQLVDHNPTKVEVFPTNFRIKQINSRAQDTRNFWLLKIPTTLRKTSKNLRKKSMLCFNNVPIWNFQVSFRVFRSVSIGFGKGKRSYQQRKEPQKTKGNIKYCRSDKYLIVFCSKSKSRSLPLGLQHVPRSSD